MTLKTLEAKVKKNALVLNKKMPNLIKTHRNEFVIFCEDALFFADTFDTAVKTGEEKFGETAGFVVRKVTKQFPVFSNLVVL